MVAIVPPIPVRVNVKEFSSASPPAVRDSAPAPPKLLHLRRSARWQYFTIRRWPPSRCTYRIQSCCVRRPLPSCARLGRARAPVPTLTPSPHEDLCG